MGTGAELGNTFLVGWVGWLEKLGLKVTLANVEVEAELGKNLITLLVIIVVPRCVLCIESRDII